MTNTEARKITFDECKVKCVACEEDCENMLIGECRKRLETLEQEPKTDILDKIRAEIKQYQSDYDVHGTEYDRTAWKAFNRCLQIIDKYRNEVSE